MTRFPLIVSLISCEMCTHVATGLSERSYCTASVYTPEVVFQITHIFMHNGYHVYNSDGILKSHSDFQFEFVMYILF